LHTGDIRYMDEGGSHYVTDRKKAMIIIRVGSGI
jgi:long-subunit acyl-CoA synthetase (AMP-forming)